MEMMWVARVIMTSCYGITIVIWQRLVESLILSIFATVEVHLVTY